MTLCSSFGQVTLNVVKGETRDSVAQRTRMEAVKAMFYAFRDRVDSLGEGKYHLGLLQFDNQAGLRESVSRTAGEAMFCTAAPGKSPYCGWVKRSQWEPMSLTEAQKLRTFVWGSWNFCHRGLGRFVCSWAKAQAIVLPRFFKLNWKGQTNFHTNLTSLNR